MSKIVYQTDNAGLYTGDTSADPSPLEPGVYLMPAGTVTEPPPQEWPDGRWPRWNGAAWDLVNKPNARSEPTATEKLQAFLEANPDVAALVEPPAPV